MTKKKPMRQSELPGIPARNHSGMALVLCLLLMTTLCLIGGAALGISGLNHRIVRNGTTQAQAFCVAEAGRELALAYIREDPVWRGGAVPASGIFDGGFFIDGIEGTFNVSLSDCTADGNGFYNELLPPGYVLLETTGTWMDALQTVSCIVRITPKEGTEASFPHAVVISSGSITGPLVPLDELGDEDTMLLKAPVVLPEANMEGLRAMAEMAFSSLDNDDWDDALSDTTSFWLDSPADTRPRILYIQGDLEISGDRQLYGIVFVEGKHISLEGESGIQGVLYAPNATDISVQNTGASGRIAVSGLFITGPGGLAVSGNQVSFQHNPDYVNAFNIVAGSEVTVDMVSGSWGMH